MLIAVLLVAAAPDAAAAPALAKVVGCRGIGDAAARLACFDREVAALQGATERREVVVMDQQQVRQTRRSLFGLSLPRIALFDGALSDGVVPGAAARRPSDQIEDSIRAFDVSREGKWIVRLEDATWQATEIDEYQDTPRVGQKVVVRRGPLGSYILTVEGRRGLRAIRLR